MHSSQALQQAVFSALSASTALDTAVGDNRVFDFLPAGEKPPYVLIGRCECSDWSTGTEDGTELQVWSEHNGRKQVFDALDAIDTELTALGGSISGHHLVNVSHVSSAIALDRPARQYRGTATFRAVTEPI